MNNMAQNKYKIRLSKDTYNALLQDMYIFNFKKPNGDLNKNKFYFKVLDGFYNKYTSENYFIFDFLKKNF